MARGVVLPGSQSGAINLSVFGTNIASTAGIDGLMEGMRLIRHRLDDSRAFLDEVAKVILSGIMENLRTAGDGEWAPLKPYTQKKRAQKGRSQGAIFPSQPILNETGAMVNAIDTLINTGKTLNIGVRGGKQAQKLAVHEFGGNAPNGGYIPPRPLMYMSERTLNNLHIMLEELLYSILASDPHRSRVKHGRMYKKFMSADYSGAWKTATRHQSYPGKLLGGEVSF